MFASAPAFELKGGFPLIKTLGESISAKRRAMFQNLLEEYGDLESIPNDVWRQILPAEAFRVCRLNTMESAVSNSQLNRNHTPGVYSCVCCGTELFCSTHKFGAGWLSFSQAIDGNVTRVPVFHHGVKRVEAQCTNCRSHLGYIYKDDVPPTGERFCVNSVALDFAIEKFDQAVRKYSRQSM
ncbi:Peptide-methionine (R)-S-oxide reductase [Aphelenchoides fujianensis]|nr:Peptide-methionine (R)-S-oxide reductase [Aphelenchoides fujianensis]